MLLRLPGDAEPDGRGGEPSPPEVSVLPDAPDDPEPAGGRASADRREALGRRETAGQWRAIPVDQRITGRRDPVMAWTGREVLVWGGRDDGGWRADGGRYDPREERWTPIPDTPVRPTGQTSGTWVGDRLAVLGAHDEEGLAHGLLAPDGDWQPAAAAPGQGWAWSSAVAVGDRVVISGAWSSGGSDGDGGTAFASYDPAGDDWAILGRAPLRRLRTLAAVDEALVAVGEATPDADRVSITARHPESGEWSPPDPAPVTGDWTPVATSDPEQGRVLLLGAAQGRGLTHVAATWAPGDGWRLLPSPPGSMARAAPQAFPTVGGTLVWTPGDPTASHRLLGDRGGPGGTAVARWQALPPPPEGVGPGAGAVWTGRELVAWGGSGSDSVGGQGAVWTPTAASAAQLPPGGSPRIDGEWGVAGVEVGGTRRGPQMTVREDTLAVWGGRGAAGPRADGVLVDVGAGLAGPIPDAPLGPRTGPAVAIADGELVVWGGSDGGADWADGAAFDLAAGTWRRLPEAPLPATSTPQVAVRDAGAVIAAGDAVARYDPAEDAWHRLETPPVGPAAALVADDRGVMLLGEDGGAARLDDGGWSRLADHGLQGDLAAVATGSAVLAWDGQRGALYDPEADRWQPTSPPWGAGPSGALAAMGDDVVVWGGARVGDARGGRVGAAALEATTARWRVLPDPPSGVSMDALATVADRVLGWSSEGRLVTFESADQAPRR